MLPSTGSTSVILAKMQVLESLSGRLGSQITSAAAAARTKLSRAWRQTRDRRLGELVSIVDRMVDARRRESREQGAESVLATTMSRCRISEEVAWHFTERYLFTALEHQARLDAEVLAATGAPDNAMDHFAYYVRTLQANREVPLFPVEGCLSFARHVARELFGLTLTEGAQPSPHVLVLDVDLDGRPVGHVNLDLWDTGPRRRIANTTKGIRNRTEWRGIEQRPVAYVSCRFRQAEDGSNRITFQNVHSLFHEFGHAVNHLLIRKRLPTQSGLEYLPLERLENLSMWFEKWVYHPQFADHLGLSSAEGRPAAVPGRQAPGVPALARRPGRYRGAGLRPAPPVGWRDRGRIPAA